MDSKLLECLHIQLWNLKPRQRFAIQLRFWNQQTIQQISEKLHLTWNETDRLIETTLRELKTRLINIQGSAQFAA